MTSIAVKELAQLGVRNFIRVGTTGAIQKAIEVGDIIVTVASVRLDGASRHYAPIEYPAVADHEVTQALVEAVKSLRLTYHMGITASTATFYPGSERYDTYSGYVIKELQGSFDDWQKLKVLNDEMESATLYVVCSTLGLRAGCVTGVVDNRSRGETIRKKDVKIAVQRAVKVAIRGMELLILARRSDHDSRLQIVPDERI